jgi:hypothetical protein
MVGRRHGGGGKLRASGGPASVGANPFDMFSALMMLRRLARTLRYAVREEDFIPVLSAGLALIVLGTVSYALGEDWNVVDALYFAVATLTTSSVADPDLVLENGWMKLFTVFYLLLGIGILVEILRRLAVAFVTVRTADEKAKESTTGGSAKGAAGGG